MFDKFSVLSLAYRSNGFVTMLAPIRDYLSPQDPQSSPLLCATRDRYFSRLSTFVEPGAPGFREAGWIASEDVNAEHLLDVFTSVDPERGDIWDVCYCFINHLYWHKPRQTMLGSKIEALADDHDSKPKCFFGLSRLFARVGNHTEQKRLLTHTLELERRREDNFQVAEMLRFLSSANRILGLYEEGIRQAKEALDIYEQIGHTTGKPDCLDILAVLFLDDGQLDEAEIAASRAIAIEKGDEFVLCELHRVLGEIYRSKGEKEKLIHHYETALGIASHLDSHDLLFWTHYELAKFSYDGRELDDATAQIELAKPHGANDPYKLGRAMMLQACVWHSQLRLEGAKSEALHALEIFENLGAAKDVKDCRNLLQWIEKTVENQSPDFPGGPLETIV